MFEYFSYEMNYRIIAFTTSSVDEYRKYKHANCLLYVAWDHFSDKSDNFELTA